MTENEPKEAKAERLVRWYRNINAAGALACFAAGAVLTGGISTAANTLGALNLLQAGAGEVLRTNAKGRRRGHK